MEAADLLEVYRLTGVLLVAAFVLFAVGGTLPVMGSRGNARVFTLPVPEHLRAVAGNAAVWRWANLLMGTAAVALLAGLTVLTALLEAAGERVLSRLGLVGFLLSTVLWVIFSVFRGVVTIRAAETASRGAVPPCYEPMAQGAFALFYVHAVVGFLALGAYGASLLEAGLVPGWAGWATLVFSLAMLLQLLITGDTLPAFHYVPPLLVGLLLVLHG